MSVTVEAWLRQKWKDKYTNKMQSRGRLLQGTALRGDTDGKTVTFAIMGKAPRPVIITKTLQKVKPANITGSTVDVTLEDRELADYVYTPDISKMGPNLADGKQNAIGMSFGREHDLVQTEAMNAFVETDTSTMEIGDGSAALSLDQLLTLKAQIAGTGSTEMGNIFCGIPHMDYSNFMLVKEFASADWIGGDALPLTQMNVPKKTWGGIHFMCLPDEYFTAVAPSNSAQQYSFLWHREAVGVETNIADGPPVMEVDHSMEGSPTLIKDFMSTAAVGILPEGVRRVHSLKRTSVAFPA
jgi:hypothetical protein